MSNLLLIDKDGTLITPAHGEFVQAPWHQLPIAAATLMLNRYRQQNWTIAIVSNQAGIFYGYKSLEQTFLEFQFCLELFPGIAEAFFCPDLGSECWRVWGNCAEQRRICYQVNALSRAAPLNYRKPEPGMLKLAIDLFNPQKILFVGDRTEDQAAAQAAGIPFQWATEWWGGKTDAV